MKCSLLTLSSYLDDELDAKHRGEAEAHLVGCQRCQGGLAHLREEVDRIYSLIPVHVPDNLALEMLQETMIVERPPESASANPGDWAPDGAATVYSPPPATGVGEAELNGGRAPTGETDMYPKADRGAGTTAYSTDEVESPEETWAPPADWHDPEYDPSLYPISDRDALDEASSIGRFGAVPIPAKSNVFSLLVDRIKARRVLSRGNVDFESQVRVVSGIGAPLRRTGSEVRSSMQVPPISRTEPMVRDGRPMLALVCGALVVMFGVGVLSGRSVTPIATKTASSAPIHVAPKPKIAPSAAPVSQTPVKTFGAHGTGYSLLRIIYGWHPEVQPAFYRVVFEFTVPAANASGLPGAVVSFPTPTTMDVTLPGTQAVSNTGVLAPNGTLVKSVTVVPSAVLGTAEYQFTLTHPVTVVGTTGFEAGNPMIFLLDIH